MSEIILEMKNITKIFPGVKALDNVNLKVEDGEIHSLVGENGAGKSTLMSVLSGVYPHGSYEGDILFKGKRCIFKNIKESEKLGIVIIHQELALIPYLSIAENIFIGNENSVGGIVNWNITIRKTRDLLKKVGLNEQTNTLITNLGIGKRQLVEIAKALSKEVKLLILDEPTAALNEKDSENLLNLLVQLKKQGISSILISHKLNEVSKISDSVTILRDGKTIETLRSNEHFEEDRIIKGMVGRDLVNRFPNRESVIGDKILEVKNWTVFHPLHEGRKIIDDISFNIKKGEIVGIAGLMGAGRTELAMSIFGKSYGKNISGKVYKEGKLIDTSTVFKSIKNGLAYVTEDRKDYGLVLIDNIKRNVVMSDIGKISKFSIVDNNKEILEAEKYKKELNIKCSSILQDTMNLSGGNQQKVVLSKWIFTDPHILILDEPTRGIDVGAKYEIYTIINRLSTEGKGILFISSELPEILGMCDRIYVMNSGKITGELSKDEATQEKIMKNIVNMNQEVRV
ncbi:MAG: multiple monosaccharide ABC transporter ATP-binding protein [Clostridiales bacterium]